MSHFSLLKISLTQLRRKKLRTILLVISIMLALSLLIGLNAGVNSLQNTYNNLVDSSLGYTDLMIKSNTTDPTFSMNTLQNALNENAFPAMSYRIQYWLPFASVNGQFNDTNGGYLVGINPETDEPFGSYKIVSGNYVSITQALAGNADTCVIDESFARRLNLTVGDTLMLGGYNSSQSFPSHPSKIMNFTVGCIIQDYGRTYWFDSKNPTSFTRVNSDITINLNVAQELLQIDSANATAAYIHVKNIEQTITLQTDLQKQLGSDYAVGTLKASVYESVNQNFATYQTISYIIGGMALMVAAMLLLNTMLANVGERKREIGILRSVGTSKPQIMGMLIAELLPVTIVGVLASIPVSIVATLLITSILPAIDVQTVGGTPSIAFTFPVSTIVSGVVIGILLTLSIGLVPAIIACRIKPVEALYPHMRNVQTNKKMKIIVPLVGFVLIVAGLYLVQFGFGATPSWFPSEVALVGYGATLIGAILLATLVLPLLSKVFSYLLWPFTGRASVLVHRNIMLNFRRSVLSYGAFAISIALLISFSSLVTTAASYNMEVNRQSSGADLQVWVTAPDSFASQLKRISGINIAAGVGYISYGQSNMTFMGNQQKNVMIAGISSKDYFSAIYQIHLTSTLDNMTDAQVFDLLVESGECIILQDSLAMNLSATVGDVLTWSISNDAEIYEQQLMVVATTDLVAGSSVTITDIEGYYAAIVSFSDMQGFRHSLLGSNVDMFYVSLDPSADINAVRDEVFSVCQENGYSPTVYSVQDTLMQSQASFVQIELLSVSVTAFFVLIGALGITSATAYTIFERKREIGVLTALGMDKHQNRLLIAGEAVLLAFIGAVVGFMSSLGLSLFVVNVIPWWANIPSPSLTISTLTILVAIVVIALSAILSSVYPANRISKLNTVDALR